MALQNPLSDGGTFCGVIDVVSKYGLVPAEAMPESYNANNTQRMASILSLKLREYGLTLRKMAAAGKKSAELEKQKVQMLATVYHILSICLGEPVQQFTWTPRDASGKALAEPQLYTPQEFYKKYVGTDLKSSYVMLMNDPSRPYHKRIPSTWTATHTTACNGHTSTCPSTKSRPWP